MQEPETTTGSDDVVLDTRGAETEIAWYYQNSARVLGLRAQRYDSDGGGATDAHDRMIEMLVSDEHSEDMERVALIEAVLERTAPRYDLELAHAPCGWSGQQRALFTRKATKVCLVPLALVSHAAMKGRDKRHKKLVKKWAKKGGEASGEPEPVEESIADFLFWEAGLNDAALRCAAICAEVTTTFESALRDYVLAEIVLAEESPAFRQMRDEYNQRNDARFGRASRVAA